jgi:hypothetical protein
VTTGASGGTFRAFSASAALAGRPLVAMVVAGNVAPGLAQQRIDEQAAAHSDAPVNPPDGERDAALFQRLAPGQYMPVNAVDQGPSRSSRTLWAFGDGTPGVVH